MRCRFCGSTSLHTDTQHKTFSAGKAAAGAVVFGVVGAAAGFIGKEKQGYRCGACGSFMELPMDTFTGMQIDTAIQKAKKGDTTLYSYYKAQYPNIENVAAAQQAPAAAPVEREIAAPTEAFGQEESTKRSYRYGSWSPDAPVYVESVILKTDGKEDRMSLVAWNQSGKELRSLYLSVIVFDDTGDEVSRCRCVYQNMAADETEPKRLPVDKTFSLNTDVAYRVQIEQEKAAFADGSTWRAAETDKTYTLPEQPLLTEENFPRIQYVKSVYRIKHFFRRYGQPKPKIKLYMPIKEEDFWLCDCGHPAKTGEPCPYCQDMYVNLEKAFAQTTLIEEQQKAVRARAEERIKKLLPKYEQLEKAKVTAEKDAKYEAAQRLFNSNSIADVEKAKASFKEMSGWKDADTLSEQCDSRIVRITEQQKKDKEEADRRAVEEAKRQVEERAAKEAAAKKRKKILAVLLPLVAALLVLFIVLVAVILPKQKQSKAEELLASGDYDSAYAQLEELGKDETVASSKYDRAKAMIDSGDYKAAYDLLCGIDYKDSRDLIKICQYNNAKELMYSGYYQDAIALFEEAIDYSDASSLIRECKYRIALELTTAKRYQEAKAVYVELGDYLDCKDKIQLIDTMIIYQEAENMLAQGKTYEAAVLFYKIKDDSDSWERCFETWGMITERATIATGYCHSVGVKENGTVISAGAQEHGENWKVDYGQCNVSNWKGIVAISARDMFTVGLKADGTVVATGDNQSGQCNVSTWKDIVAISAGGSFTVGIKADGTVVATGYNDAGQCDVSEWKDIIAVSAGYDYTIGLKSDGTVLATGKNDRGQCNVYRWNGITAISASQTHTVGLERNGTVVVAGGIDTFGTDKAPKVDHATAAYAGRLYTLCLTEGGDRTFNGYLLAGFYDARWEDVVAVSTSGYDHAIVLYKDGTVVALGENDCGECDVSEWTNIKLPNH